MNLQVSFVVPYTNTDQRQAVAHALEVVNFEPQQWRQNPVRLQALKDLGLGDANGFCEDMRERIGRTLYSSLFFVDALSGGFEDALNSGTADRPHAFGAATSYLTSFTGR